MVRSIQNFRKSNRSLDLSGWTAGSAAYHDLYHVLVFVIERYISLYGVAKGKSSVQVFFKKLITLIQNDDFDGALAACDKQRGTTANVLRAGIDRYREVKGDAGVSMPRRRFS